MIPLFMYIQLKNALNRFKVIAAEIKTSPTFQIMKKEMFIQKNRNKEKTATY